MTEISMLGWQVTAANITSLVACQYSNPIVISNLVLETEFIGPVVV